MGQGSQRDEEEFLLDRCVSLGRLGSGDAHDEREANVFLLAAIVLETGHLDESEALRLAAEQFFEHRHLKPLSVRDVIQRGWIVGLPRLRDMLRAKLNERPARPVGDTQGGA